MNPGETIWWDHLYVALTVPNADGSILLANFTTHGTKGSCGSQCLVVTPPEFVGLSRDSCIFVRLTSNPYAPLVGAPRAEPVSNAVLRSIQDWVLGSKYFSRTEKSAVQASL